MDLPLMHKKHDVTSVIVDRVTKSAHFVPIQVDYPYEKL